MRIFCINKPDSQTGQYLYTRSYFRGSSVFYGLTGTHKESRDPWSTVQLRPTIRKQVQLEGTLSATYKFSQFAYWEILTVD